MSTSDFETYWSEIIADCPVHPEGHTRMEWHSLGMCCARCDQHTGNNHQGHYWGLCKDPDFRSRVEAQYGGGREIPLSAYVRELHFCCPDDCALEA